MKMKKIYLFILVFFLIFNVCVRTARGQNSKSNSVLSISGTVVDAENSKPLSFASVGILNKANGTITNTSGLFELSIPKDFQNDTLVISMMGYLSVKTPIGTS